MNHGIVRVAPSLPTGKPLPDRREDGCYSLNGAVKHFGTTKNRAEEHALWCHIDSSSNGVDAGCARHLATPGGEEAKCWPCFSKKAP
jgi:hypothetical protein